ncbi:hypothetical protein, partial [Burkholderia sp. LMG 13014]|uniref:hypothetical protein n=1 Tax=Burkholderia sp. LMG 13014 TaxID=2709306 RepID=UPI0019626C4C
LKEREFIGPFLARPSQKWPDCRREHETASCQNQTSMLTTALATRQYMSNSGKALSATRDECDTP